jgi:spore coat protein A
MVDRRRFLKASVAAALATGAAGHRFIREAYGTPLAVGLSDPAIQPIFVNPAANAMSGAFKYVPNPRKNQITIGAGQTVQQTGLVSAGRRPRRLWTTVWGYGVNDGVGVTWPGRTLELNVDDDPLTVNWENWLRYGNRRSDYRPLPHLLPVDTSVHWAYSLHGASSANGVDYRQYSIEENGVPIVTHVHGGRNDSAFDGNPEYFFSPDGEIKGPRWEGKQSIYGGDDWNDTAGTTWYHDHALGLTRLNVYAGLAGFVPVRDQYDTGKPDNPADLPADPYELGFAVQDRMFWSTGELFYPAFPGDPFYSDFIDGEGAVLPPDIFPGGGPTALAEFFGDHMVVNGTIWPKYSVERRQYRIRLLNGTDSRFMRLKLKVIAGGASDPAKTDPSEGYTMPFLVIGSDQSLREQAAMVSEIDFIPGERLDLIIDFNEVPDDSRVIVENLLGDSPFGGDLPGPEDVFPDRRTDRVMAFDVELPFNNARPDTTISSGTAFSSGGVDVPDTSTVRKLALFEGTDEFGRLQPLLGTAEPVMDVDGSQVTGSLTWFQPITENPGLNDTEIWEIYNATGDAHPIHVHLVHFEIMDRQDFTAQMIEQDTQQHNGTTGTGFRLESIQKVGAKSAPEPAEQTRRDMVMALPEQVTRIKMTFDKPGRYVWHCHILSHEDHEMMRPFHGGPVAG